MSGANQLALLVNVPQNHSHYTEYLQESGLSLAEHESVVFVTIASTVDDSVDSYSTALAMTLANNEVAVALTKTDEENIEFTVLYVKEIISDNAIYSILENGDQELIESIFDQTMAPLNLYLSGAVEIEAEHPHD